MLMIAVLFFIIQLFVFFFFSSRRRHTRYIGDWSSDVCSSDLFAQPNRLYSAGFGFLGYPDASFPFSYATLRHPASGKADGLLARCSAHKNCPKIVHTVSSTEYWQGGHSLNTTDPLGERDVMLPENVR